MLNINFSSAKKIEIEVSQQIPKSTNPNHNNNMKQLLIYEATVTKK